MRVLMDHIVLNIKNENEMISFYSAVLQLPTERLEEYREGKVPFASVRINANTIIDLFPKRMWASDTNSDTGGYMNLNHFCLSIEKDEWTHLRDRLVSSGVTIEEGPVPRWGAHGTGTSIYFRDPDRNLIEAKYYEKQENVG